jgi:predicted kinase
MVDETYAELFATAKAHLRAGSDVVLDTPGTSYRLRGRALSLAALCGASAHLVVVDAPLDVCIGRQAGRSHPVPEAKVRDIWSDVQAIDITTKYEGWATIQHVSGV